MLSGSPRLLTHQRLLKTNSPRVNDTRWSALGRSVLPLPGPRSQENVTGKACLLLDRPLRCTMFESQLSAAIRSGDLFYAR
jgi:hypothetical protein